MGLIANFTDDIFISYAHDDNQPLYEGQRRWVESFDQALGIRLRQLLGAREKLSIWRDQKLGGTGYVTDTLVHRIKNTAILVTILSPSYLSSDWCLKELEQFHAGVSNNGGVRIGNIARVAKVIKTPIPLEKHPAKIRDLLGFEFYQVDSATGKAREFSAETSPTRDIRYWDKLEDVAQELKQLIDLMQDGGPSEASVRSGATIYLAETISDLNHERDKVKRELEQFGHLILPDKALPMKAPALLEAVRGYLQRSRLSVHLIGEHYGTIPEMETERSVICLQQELAVERGDDAEFSRLIWMPPGLQPKDERQKKYVVDLQHSFSSYNGSELLEVKLEDLKTIIQTKLNQKPKPASAPSEENGAMRIYLICDKQDVDAVEPLRSYLFERQTEAILPLLEGTDVEALEDHKENLLLCDAVMIFQGRASQGWLRMKLNDLLKLRGYGRITPLCGKAVYLGTPALPLKERFHTLEALVIKNYGEFNPASVDPFLNQIRKAKG